MVDDDEFELENDDFLTETFLSIPDSELVGPSVSEHSIESDCQPKCDVIVGQFENSRQCISSVENRENVATGALNSSSEEDVRLDKNTFNTLVSSTPLVSINKQKQCFIHTPDKESGDIFCSKNDINYPSNEKKERCFDFLKPNIQDKSCIKSDTSVKQTIENKSYHLDGSLFSNKLLSGVVSSAKKRKFSGPAGLLPATQDEALMKQLCSSGETRRSSIVSSYNIDYQQNIASSQYTPEALQGSPWKTLQADVSSCLHNFSSAQNFSIRRILLESSKKKMPKYMVIPFLCILIKKISVKDPNAKSVFMDETGEINGKIDKEVMEKYSKEIVEGSAVILRNVGAQFI
ncbi:uncharacterized protein LOC129216792 [Uloborus diversus]|uniref:uncharacterized protein LOC129216792 n=1 Tax=Uloborus diversus TaxID=327109 RepID=UPI002409D995|nr:uncharacterized protein LOC129216792 [Uloborus diversus]